MSMNTCILTQYCLFFVWPWRKWKKSITLVRDLHNRTSNVCLPSSEDNVCINFTIFPGTFG